MTWIVTVTVPPEAIVTEPANTLLARLKLAVVALALTLLEKPVALNSAGMVSLIELASVEGPAFVTTSVKLVVLPTATVVEPTSLLTPRLTVGMTPITAEAVDELVPTEVVSEPGAIVLVTVPPIELVTTTVIVQVEACGIKVPIGRVNEPVFGVAVATPAVQPMVLTDGGAALTKPVG